MNCERSRQLMDAYLDAELDEATASDLSNHLTSCSACAGHHRVRESLRAALHGLVQPPAPARLRAAIAARLDWEDRPIADRHTGSLVRRRDALVLAAMLSLAGFGLGLAVARWPAGDSFDALAARHAARLAGPQVMVRVQSDDRHVVKPWFAGRVSFGPPVRDLRSIGFTLVGGDLDAFDGRETAVVVYRIRNHDVSVFVRASPGGPELAPAARIERGFNLVHWTGGGLRCVAVSDVGPDDLMRLARALAAPG